MNGHIFAPGDVVIADLAPTKGGLHGAAPHPCAVVEVSRDGHHVVLARITTTRTYTGGSPRAAVPDWPAIGLRLPSFWWSGSLVTVNVCGVHEIIGRLTARAWCSLLATHELRHAA